MYCNRARFLERERENVEERATVIVAEFSRERERESEISTRIRNDRTYELTRVCGF